MFDFTQCVRSNDGRVFCWDKAKNTFVKITVEEMAIASVPAEVIAQFMVMRDQGEK